MPPVTIRSKTDARQSRPVQVAEEIKNWVVEQALEAGDRLPSEPEMIARFGMSKGTIREAMRILEAQGLIRTRTGPGGGSFVHEVSKERARALLGNYFYFRHLTIADIYQLRRLLEPELVAGLAGTLTPEVLEELEENIASYASPAETLEDEREQHVASLRFHAILAAQAGNDLLGFLIEFMVSILADTALRGDDADESAASRAKQEAEARLAGAKDQMDLAQAQAELVEAAARLEFVKNLKKPGR